MCVSFSSAFCYCTAEPLSSRGLPPVRRPSVKPIFAETAKRINAKFGGKLYLSTISPNIFFFNFFLRFFSFSLTWDHMGVKISNDISFESTHQILSPKITHTPRGFLPKLLTELWSFKLWIFANFFSVSVNMVLHASERFKRHLLWEYAPDSLPKSIYTTGEGLYQNCEIWKFEFLAIFLFFFFSVWHGSQWKL